MRIKTNSSTGAAFELLASCTLALTITGWAGAQPQFKHPAEPMGQARHELPGARVTFAQRQALAAYGPEIRVALGDEEVPTSLTGQLSVRVHPDDAVAEAQAALKLHGAAFRVRQEDGFMFGAFEPDESGVSSVRMQQTYKGIPVIGGELVVQLSPGQVTGISGSFVPDLDVPTDAVNPGAAVASALSYAHEVGYLNPQVGEARTPVIFVNGRGAGHLAIPVRATHDGPDGTVLEDIWVDASNGTVLRHIRLWDKRVSSTPGSVM
jgi:zinc metalloprotease ZmpA